MLRHRKTWKNRMAIQIPSCQSSKSSKMDKPPTETRHMDVLVHVSARNRRLNCNCVRFCALSPTFSHDFHDYREIRSIPILDAFARIDTIEPLKELSQ